MVTFERWPRGSMEAQAENARRTLIAYVRTIPFHHFHIETSTLCVLNLLWRALGGARGSGDFIIRSKNIVVPRTRSVCALVCVS